MQAHLHQKTSLLALQFVHSKVCNHESRLLRQICLASSNSVNVMLNKSHPKRSSCLQLSTPGTLKSSWFAHPRQRNDASEYSTYISSKLISSRMASKLFLSDMNQLLKDNRLAVQFKPLGSSGDLIDYFCGHKEHSSSEYVESLVQYLTLLCLTFILLYCTHDDLHLIGVRVGQCTTSHLENRDEKFLNNKEQAPDCHGRKRRSKKSNTASYEKEPISLEEAVKKTQVICERKKKEIGTPGLVVCVSVDGRQVYAEGFGYADLENEVTIEPNSVLRIASISKSVTAVIVARLWESDKIDLDKTVQHYVPDFPQKYFMGEKVDITVNQLLNHTSGIRHYKKEDDPAHAFDEKIVELVKKTKEASVLPFYAAGAVTKKTQLHDSKMPFDALQSKKEKELFNKESFPTITKSLSLFQNDPLLCKPGSKFMYTTHGFTLLSAIVESVANCSFPEMVTKTFHSMGMKESYLDKSGPIVYNRARYYMKDKAGTVVNTPYVDSSYKWGGGGLLSTTEDLIKFGNILLYSSQHEDGDPGPPGYLKASTVWKFWCPPGNEQTVTPRYGLGFELSPEEQHYGMCGRHSFGSGHTGSAVGASSILFILPRCAESEQKSPDSESDQCNTSSKDSDLQRKSMKLKCGATLVNIENGLPQGVVVAVIANLSSVNLRTIAKEIAQNFENVDFSL